MQCVRWPRPKTGLPHPRRDLLLQDAVLKEVLALEGQGYLSPRETGAAHPLRGRPSLSRLPAGDRRSRSMMTTNTPGKRHRPSFSASQRASGIHTAPSGIQAPGVHPPGIEVHRPQIFFTVTIKNNAAILIPQCE